MLAIYACVQSCHGLDHKKPRCTSLTPRSTYSLCLALMGHRFFSESFTGNA